MPEQAQRANRAGAMARARGYVEGGAFEHDLERGELTILSRPKDL